MPIILNIFSLKNIVKKLVLVVVIPNLKKIKMYNEMMKPRKIFFPSSNVVNEFIITTTKQDAINLEVPTIN